MFEQTTSPYAPQFGRTIMDAFSAFGEPASFSNLPQPTVVKHYGFDEDGAFVCHATNPYIERVKAWDGWKKIGDRFIATQIDIDLSGSMGGNEVILTNAIRNAINGLRTERPGHQKYDFAPNTWVRVVGFNSYGYTVLIDWAPLMEIDTDNLPPLYADGVTPISTALTLDNESMRNFAAAVKAHARRTIVGCNLVLTDGAEQNDNRYQAPFTAGDVQASVTEAEYVDSDNTKPLIHALHNTLLFVGSARYIGKCETYATEAGYAFSYFQTLDEQTLVDWFIGKIHTASAIGGETGQSDLPGVVVFEQSDDVEVDDDEEPEDVFKN